MDEKCHFPSPGLKQANLKKSFKLGVRSLLTACPKEEFLKRFPTLNKVKQERLYQLFIQVITSLHENVEEEFESICLETQVGTALDTVDQLVEEQTLDILSDDTTNFVDVKQDESRAKKEEINYLMSMLEMVVEHNHATRVRFESLKKEKQDSPVTVDAIEKRELFGNIADLYIPDMKSVIKGGFGAVNVKLFSCQLFYILKESRQCAC